MTAQRWQPGDQVVVRSMWSEKIQIAMPMTVIADTEQISALYLAAGTPIKNKSTYRSDHLPIGEWELVDDVWRDDLVRVKYAGDAHAYYAMWKGGRFHRWYINLESPYERTPVGVDFTDHVLDIVVHARRGGLGVEGCRRAGKSGRTGACDSGSSRFVCCGREAGSRTP